MVGPPVRRHVAAVSLTVGLTGGLFWGFGAELPLSHALLADVSIVLLCLVLALGAAGRLIPRLRPIVPLSRELGIAMFVTASLHVAIIIGPEFDVLGWISDLFTAEFGKFDDMWVAGNWLGFGALVVAIPLVVTSNDWSQRMLGRSWKFLQRHAYSLFILTWLHTAAFLLFRGGHDTVMPVWIFWTITIGVVLAQLAGFVHTVVARRAPSQLRVPPKRSPDEAVDRRAALGRWAVVVTLWIVLIVGAWMLSMVESQEEVEEAARLAELCERYNEMGRPPVAGDVRKELQAIVPDWDTGEVIQAAQECTRQ